jgi:chaperonin GroES
MSINFKPTDDHVLIERETEQTTTESGLVLPTSGEKPPMGYVRAKGDKATQVKVGDKVVFGKYKGEEITLQGKDYLILRELEIAGILG